MGYRIRARSEIAAGVEVSPGSKVSVRLTAPPAIVLNVAAGAAGPPGAGGASYLHTQASPASTWTVNHNLGTRPAVEVRDTGGNEILAGVTHASANQVLISFVSAKTGTAFCSL